MIIIILQLDYENETNTYMYKEYRMKSVVFFNRFEIVSVTYIFLLDQKMMENKRNTQGTN